MRRTGTFWIAVAAAGLGFALAGCGGSDSPDEVELAPLAPMQAEAPPPPPPGESEPAAEEPGAVAEATAEEAAPEPAPEVDQAASEPEPEPQAAEAPTRAARQPKSADAAATDDLLALAKAAPVARPVFVFEGESGEGESPAQGMAADGYYPESPPEETAMAGESGDAYVSELDPASGGLAGVGGETVKDLDFTNPIKGAQTFLEAVQKKDARAISEAIALRAPQEAQPKNRAMFQRMLEGPQSIDESTLTVLHDAMKDMKLFGTNQVRSTARLGVIVGRRERNGTQVTRTIEMRREKAGWKVSDVSGPRIQKMPSFGRRNPNQAAAGSSDGSNEGP